MINVLSILRKRPKLEQVLSITNDELINTLKSVRIVEELKCTPWTTRKLKIPTSAEGYIIVECFESAEGKRLKGFGKMEPEFSLSNLKIMVENSFGYDELRLFPIPDADPVFTETDFMSQEVIYPKWGRLNVAISLSFGKTKVRCKLWF